MQISFLQYLQQQTDRKNDQHCRPYRHYASMTKNRPKKKKVCSRIKHNIKHNMPYKTYYTVSDRRRIQHVAPSLG